ncbi:heme ABC exporter ATP-binding protein CcmA [Vulgatibacter sp.]|uniref:heme ABC exporter ATP-binding protein CcmA n=1 Tax=Vulgatibacter sp. TaxID=1971226 RepID=UPI0035634B5D
MKDNHPAVEAEGLCRRYGRSWALIDIDLKVPRGTALLVAGRNGSGKSTLFRVLAGALKPDRGSYRMNGHDGIQARQEARAQVGLLGHYSNTWDALSALQNLQVTARFAGRPAGRRDLMPLLEEVGLAERADSPITSFSAGMRKRIAFARVLLQEPSVILLDEPYGQLDPPGFAFVDALIPRLTARGTTVLMASHHLEKGAELCDMGIALERGRVIFSGRAKDLPAAFAAHHAPARKLEAVR